jgi:hypothetical protein
MGLSRVRVEHVDYRVERVGHQSGDVSKCTDIVRGTGPAVAVSVEDGKVIAVKAPGMVSVGKEGMDSIGKS